MKRTIIVCGHGPGISDAVARKFGREGHPVAIVARNADRLATAAKALVDAGLEAKAFACDLGDADAVRRLVGDVRESLGPIGVVHWNAYTGGGLAFYDPKVDAQAVDWNAMGLAIGKAAQHKTVGLLHQRLARDGIYVGEVVVLGLVKGTAWDSGNATLDPADIANKFWALHEGRTETTVNFG
ncbi:MAG TPA: SDR family NAD(P)-dependent oxidoreductase [Labilithrix sp.]|nr:SDR family NAD(P)-dependent oxidoreductase [Labilithrix sp.]